jgi:hypothetical protein
MIISIHSRMSKAVTVTSCRTSRRVVDEPTVYYIGVLPRTDVSLRIYASMNRVMFDENLHICKPSGNLKSAKRNSDEVKFVFYFRSAAIHRCFLSVSYHHGRRRHSTAPRTPLSCGAIQAILGYYICGKKRAAVGNNYITIIPWNRSKKNTLLSRAFNRDIAVKPSDDLSRRCWSRRDNTAIQLALYCQTNYTY